MWQIQKRQCYLVSKTCLLSSIHPTYQRYNGIEGHPLSKECLYIVYLTITACQGYVKHLYDITTEAEFDEWRNQYIESRRSSTVSDWFCAVGRKPTA